ncbi:hypothetical protein [Streptomyces sp. NPDC127100]|uniref:hypothetical protein n=1 Tax=Streptomyces sp. NPDC127100 TaxID=3347138 RepID=UPI00365D8117
MKRLLARVRATRSKNTVIGTAAPKGTPPQRGIPIAASRTGSPAKSRPRSTD